MSQTGDYNPKKQKYVAIKWTTKENEIIVTESREKAISISREWCSDLFILDGKTLKKAINYDWDLKTELIDI